MGKLGRKTWPDLAAVSSMFHLWERLQLPIGLELLTLSQESGAQKTKLQYVLLGCRLRLSYTGLQIEFCLWGRNVLYLSLMDNAPPCRFWWLIVVLTVFFSRFTLMDYEVLVAWLQKLKKPTLTYFELSQSLDNILGQVTQTRQMSSS